MRRQRSRQRSRQKPMLTDKVYKRHPIQSPSTRRETNRAQPEKKSQGTMLAKYEHLEQIPRTCRSSVTRAHGRRPIAW
jgi:hypothetical protein